MANKRKSKEEIKAEQEELRQRWGNKGVEIDKQIIGGGERVMEIAAYEKELRCWNKAGKSGKR